LSHARIKHDQADKQLRDTKPEATTDVAGRLCAVTGCGRPGVEKHHFFPVAIFGKAFADRWPTALLCRRCHALWHWYLTPVAFARRIEAIRTARQGRRQKQTEAERLPLFEVAR